MHVLDANMGPATFEELNTEDDLEPLRCWDCNVSFTSRVYLNEHLLHHIKQPRVVLTRYQYQAPIKITLKSNKDNNFEIVSSPQTAESRADLAQEPKSSDIKDNTEESTLKEDEDETKAECVEEEMGVAAEESEEPNVRFSPNLVDNIDPDVNLGDTETEPIVDDQMTQDYGNIPGAEPTPPPEEPPHEYPKIRIKTTGLLKESLTITEITDDNPEGDLRSELIELGSNDNQSAEDYNGDSNAWTTQSLDDPLRLSAEKPDANLLSLFGSNNERAKDLGFTTSDSEFISLDRLDDRNQNALQLYNSRSVTSGVGQNPLESLTGLPMQQLAQQVSRLQPGNGMHQQNVLINIQQFPQAPPQPQHGFQPPPMYHHPPQPMYQPYQYQPPNHMYYPPAPGYPPHMPPPPPQIGQPPPQQQPPMQQPPQQPYRPPMGPRQASAPRQQAPGQRAPMSPRQPMAPRQPMMGARQRGPMPRPRGPMPTMARGVRPRMPMQQMQGPRMVKRSPEQMNALQAKRKKMDVLVPDKNDDPDCQVICTQPKNTDGGLPQIQSVQGGTPDPTDGNIMHLSDSITLSVRNPPPRTQSPKKSDAKAVANILATRGITVTATAKPKEMKPELPKKASPPPPPVAINLNSAVSIIPAAKSNSKPPGQSNSDPRLPTVDLTDDRADSANRSLPPPKPVPPNPQKPAQRGNLPFRCDLCPAQYPNSIGLSKHKQTYHKTGGPHEIGVPLVNLKMPGVLQKLSSLGICNYIPLPGAGADLMFGIPVVNARNPANAAAIGAASVLTLGPIRNIPKPPPPQMNNNNHNAAGK